MRQPFTLQTALQAKLLREHFPAGAEWHGSLDEFPCERLVELSIFCRESQASATLEAMPRSANTPISLRLVLKARTESPCGRCMEPVPLQQSWEKQFVLFDTAAAADEALDLNSDADPLSSEDGLCLGDVFEDEILMALTEPLRHANCQAAPLAALEPSDSASAEPTQRPFAGLAGLLNSGKK